MNISYETRAISYERCRGESIPSLFAYLKNRSASKIQDTKKPPLLSDGLSASGTRDSKLKFSRLLLLNCSPESPCRHSLL